MSVPKKSAQFLPCIVAVWASHLGIKCKLNLVDNPADSSRDGGTQEDGHGEVDGEMSVVLHAFQDEHLDGEHDGRGEDGGEFDLPGRRHRGRLISMANSRGLEGGVWYWRRVVCV